MEKNNIIGVYEDPDVLVSAIQKIKENGINIKHVFSPFPIHGVFEKLKMNTRLPMLTFIYGAIGFAVTFAFLYWTSVVSYPLKFGGKPLNSLSFMIIIAVGTIFFGILLTFMTFFFRQKLWPGKKVAMIDPRSTDDKFIIVVEKDPDFSDADVSKINSILKETGAVEINEKPLPENYVEEEND